MSDVLIFEEHSSSLPVFWRLGPGRRTLVCLDAHLDLQAISSTRLGLLQRCQSVDEVMALEKPHHVLPDKGYAYSLEDWLYPAHRLHLFDKLVWVAPPHVRVDASAEVLMHLEQMDGVTPDELASFAELPGGGFRGVLAGVPITVCNHRQLHSLALTGPVLLDIDTDYFVEVPGDQVWVDPREVLDTVRAALPTPAIVTIARSSGSGFLPLRHRYLADYVAALCGAQNLDTTHYQRLFELETHEPDRDARAAGFAQEARQFPQCAATRHLWSLALSDTVEASLRQAEAESLDAAYRPDVLSRACAYTQRRIAPTAQDCLALVRDLDGMPASTSLQACAHAAVGKVLCAAGMVDAAIEQHARCSALGGPHPGLCLDIGRALIARGRTREAHGFLHVALDDDVSRNSSRVYLAELHARAGRLEAARDLIAAAHASAPAWRDVASMFGRLAQGR
jgi:hypothetical protein